MTICHRIWLINILPRGGYDAFTFNDCYVYNMTWGVFDIHCLAEVYFGIVGI